MKSKHNTKKGVLYLFTSFLIVISIIFLFVYRYDYINTRYPSPIRITYNMGQSIDYNELELCFYNTEILSFDTVVEKYDLGNYNMGTVNSDEKIVFVYLKIRNNSNSDKKIEIFGFRIQSGAWSNGLNYELYLAINDNVGIQPIVNGNQTLEIIIPYSAYDAQFKRDDWRLFESRTFEISLSVYPFKKSVIIYR